MGMWPVCVFAEVSHHEMLGLDMLRQRAAGFSQVTRYGMRSTSYLSVVCSPFTEDFSIAKAFSSERAITSDAEKPKF